MRILKIIFILLAILISLVLIVSAFLPSSYKVERSIIINAPIEMVFDEINDFGKMNHWSPWKEIDPDMKTVVSGTKGQPGYKYSWGSENKKIGNGSIARTHTEENKILVSDLIFEDFDMKSKVTWMFDQTPEGVKVTWQNTGDIGFLFRIPITLMDMESMMAPDHEKGLKMLKDYCETEIRQLTDEAAAAAMLPATSGDSIVVK